MSKKVKFALDREGVRELMLSDEMKNILDELGNATLARTDQGYEYKLDVGKGRTRLHANIKADSYKAYYHNLKSNTLLKALKGNQK